MFALMSNKIFKNIHRQMQFCLFILKLMFVKWFFVRSKSAIKILCSGVMDKFKHVKACLKARQERKKNAENFRRQANEVIPSGNACRNIESLL